MSQSDAKEDVMEVVERVARAIEATMFTPHELPCDAELHAKYIGTARAAIEAMREPTNDIGFRLLANMDNNEDSPNTFSDAADLWRDLIDAALGKSSGDKD